MFRTFADLNFDCLSRCNIFDYQLTIVVALVAAVIAYFSGDAFDRQIVEIVQRIISWILSFVQG